jgi:hypothetical protein
MGFSMHIQTDYQTDYQSDNPSDNPSNNKDEGKLVSDGYITIDKSFYSIVLHNQSNKDCKIFVYYDNELIQSIDNLHPYKELVISRDLDGNRLQFKKNPSLNNPSIVAIFAPILPLKTSQHSVIITIPILINSPISKNSIVKSSTLINDGSVNYMIECCINAVKVISDNFSNDV